MWVGPLQNAINTQLFRSEVTVVTVNWGKMCPGKVVYGHKSAHNHRKFSRIDGCRRSCNHCTAVFSVTLLASTLKDRYHCRPYKTKTLGMCAVCNLMCCPTTSALLCMKVPVLPLCAACYRFESRILFPLFKRK